MNNQFAFMSSERGGGLLKWVVILAIVGAAGWGGFTYWKQPKQAPIEYKTSPVTKGDVVQSVTANGSLNPVRLVEIGSQISGTLTDVKVDFNSKVKAGDVVAQIDPATYERALGQAEAELTNAEAALELSQLNFDRAQDLFKANLISKSEYDQLRINLSQAKAGVKTRQANVERAKVDLSRTTIYTPMDGIVISRKVESGQTVAASMNAPVLFVIANDLAKMQIEASVSEADVGGLEEGQTVQFLVDAFPGRNFTGKVQQVRYAPTTNQNVVTYTTVVAVDNRDLKLRPGMTATAKFITAERKGVLRVPQAAIRWKPPTGAIVKGDTNAPAAEKSTAAASAPALIESGPFAGLPVMPWTTGGERRRPTEAERAAYAASLTPEQKQKYDQITAEMRARFAQGGGGGGGGGGGFGGGGGGGGGGGERRRTETETPKSGTVYIVEKQPGPLGAEVTSLKPVNVRLGIGDGVNIEVLEGLKEGDVIATGTLTAASATAAAPRNPMSNPFGGGGGRPR